MSSCSTRSRTRRHAALIAGPDHASERGSLCHSHAHASGLVNAPVDGARVVASTFLEVDPMEGGSCNDYDYVCGDPVNELDLTGEGFSAAGHNPRKPGEKHGSCRGGQAGEDGGTDRRWPGGGRRQRSS